MSGNEGPDRDGQPGRIDEEALGSWVRDVADETGTTEREVLDRMLSAYWLIDEFEGSSRDASFDPSEPFDDDRSDLDAEFLSPANSTPETDDPDSVEPDGDPPGEPDTEFAQLSAKLDRIAELLGNGADGGSDEDRTDAELEALDDRLDALDDRTEALADAVDGLRTHVEELDRETPDSGTVERLQDAVPEVAREVQHLREDHDTLRSEISEDFGHIERILRHLLDRTDDLKGSLKQVTSREKDRNRSRADERLMRLKRTASAEGIRSAECGECDGSVDLGVLPEPRCPHCGAEFRSLEPKSWLFGSNTLSVRPAQTPNRREPIDSSRQNADRAAGNAPPRAESTGTSRPDVPPAGEERGDSVGPDGRTAETSGERSGIMGELGLSDDIRAGEDGNADASRADVEDGTRTGSGTDTGATENGDDEATGVGFDWGR